MAKEANFDPKAYMADLMKKKTSELKVQRAKRGLDWNALPEEKKAKIGKMILANNAAAAAFKGGEIDQVSFFEINPDGNEVMTPIFIRGQKVTVNIDGEIKEDVISEFVQTGSNIKFNFIDEEGNEKEVRASGMSIKTLNFNKTMTTKKARLVKQ